MQTQRLSLQAADGHAIPTYLWTRKGKGAHGVVLISHGMAEHAARYRWVAEQLTNAGFAVFAHDHRGHGECIAEGMEGLYAESDGWNKVVSDLGVVHAEARKRYPNLPIVLVAHSMGTFISQAYVSKQGTAIDLAGLVLSGSSLEPTIRIRAMKPLIGVEKRRVGAFGTSAVIHAMTFGNFERVIGEKRTEFDWLSRDSHQVDLYVADPWCGFDCKVQLWEDLSDGLLALSQKHHFQHFPHHLPLYVFSGDRDPVGDLGRSVRRLASTYIQHGQLDVTCRLYPGGRHEMFNESYREEVCRHLLEWMNQRVWEERTA